MLLRLAGERCSLMECWFVTIILCLAVVQMIIGFLLVHDSVLLNSYALILGVYTYYISWSIAYCI